MTTTIQPFPRRGGAGESSVSSAAEGDAVGVFAFDARFLKRQSFLFFLGDGVDAVFFLPELGVADGAFEPFFGGSSVSLALLGVSLLGVSLLGVLRGDTSHNSTCQLFSKWSSSLEFLLCPLQITDLTFKPSSTTWPSSGRTTRSPSSHHPFCSTCVHFFINAYMYCMRACYKQTVQLLPSVSARLLARQHEDVPVKAIGVLIH